MKIKTILRSAFNHPFLLSTIFSLLTIYKYLPFLFHILTFSFPTILFTAIFLGIILIHGEPNPTQNQLNRLNHTRIGLTNRLEPTEPNKSNKSYESSSDSEINPSLDEIHPLLESAQVSESESESESEKDETKQESKTEKVVAWTADDQKTLQQIGSLEIERNTHLENLIARRKAVRKILERDLIDLDGSDSTQFHQIQPIIAPRRNPFDLPYEEEIPGSAPSVLLPISRNPFDFPFDQIEEPNETLNPNLNPIASNSNTDVNVNVNVSSNVSNNANSGFMNNNNTYYNNEFKKNALFRRHESFTIGAPVQFLGEIRAENRGNYNRFKPFFMPEKMDFEEESVVERESSEKSGSLERETSLTHDDVSDESSDESSSVEGERKEERELTDDESKDLEKYEHYNSSSSEEEESNNNEKLEGGNEKTINLGSIHEAFEDDESESESNVQQLGKEEEPIADCHVADPVYDSDSSPSAHEKPSILVEALFNDANTKAELDSKEILSPPKEKKEEALNAWVAPSLASVDEIESRSRGISEIKERDIIGAQISEIHDDLSCPITPIVANLDR